MELDITVNKENIPKSFTERYFVVKGNDKNCNKKNIKLGISKYITLLIKSSLFSVNFLTILIS